MIKKLAIAVSLTGIALGLQGCGVQSIVARKDIAPAGLLLSDSTTQKSFSMTVAGGLLSLAEVSNTAQSTSDATLIDQTTGVRYSLVIVGGALTLAPVSSGSSAEDRIALVDISTSKTYALEIVAGSVTLISA